MTKTFKLTIGVLIITALAVLLVSIPKRINNDNDNGNVIVQPIEEQEPTIEETEEIEEIVPSEDIDTTNWKTYRNEEYGFSFKYPEGWTLSEGNWPNTTYAVGLNSVDNERSGKCRENGCDLPNSARIEIYKNISELDTISKTHQELKTYLEDYSKMSAPIYNDYSNMKIGNKDGYKAIAGPNHFGRGIFYLVDNNKIIYRIWFFEFDNDYSAIVTDQILSTFQFTK